METFDNIFSRRSIRKFTSSRIPNKELEKILKAGMHAPSAVNKQPWHFVVFDDEKLINAIVEIHPNAFMLRQASHGILICYDEQLEHAPGFGIVDCSAAVQNMLLAANEMGFGACWIGIHPRQERKEHLHKLFELPLNIQPHTIVALGYPDEIKEMPDRFKPERIHWGKW